MNPRKKLKIGVVGATGMVGQAFMKLLEERNFPLEELRPFASDNSVGKELHVQSQKWICRALKQACFDGLDLVFFSSGDAISKEWAPEAVRSGAYAVDNSAAFRMESHTELIVPEVNGDRISSQLKPQIIANPNCSTIQLAMTLKPLKDQFGIDDVKVSTYQAVSGAGQAGYDELIGQTENYKNKDSKPQPQAFPHPILFNVIPQIGSFNEQGFCTEEVKIMNETRKILADEKLKISAFTVRVPALNSHSETVWVTLKKEVNRDQIISSLRQFPGLVVLDDPTRSVYPTPRDVSGEDPVYIGRIHRDTENKYLWLMWVVSDNLKKGAALNGIQIAERIFDITPGT